MIFYTQHITTNKLIEIFCKKYDFKFHGWVSSNTADFKWYCFTIDQMKIAISKKYSLKELIYNFTTKQK